MEPMAAPLGRMKRPAAAAASSEATPKRPAGRASSARGAVGGSSSSTAGKAGSEVGASKKVVEAMKNPTTNILRNVLDRQMGCMSAEDKASVHKNAEAFKRVGGFRHGGLCSGSNVAYLSTLTLFLTLLGLPACQNMFDVDKDKDKQAWLSDIVNKGIGKSCIFKEMGDMSDTHAECCTHNGLCRIPSGKDGPHLATCGFSCKDISKANPKRGVYSHGVKLAAGNTAFTLICFWQYCTFHRLPFAICENVTEFLADTSSNLAEFSHMFGGIGYVFKHVIVDASLWVAQRRKRVYFILLNLAKCRLTLSEGKALLVKIVATINSFEADRIPIKDTLLPRRAKRVRMELDECKLAAKERAPSAGEVRWPEQHLTEMHRKGLSHSSLADEGLSCNDWFQTLPEREQSVIKFKRQATPNAYSFDSSQSIDRATCSSNDDQVETTLISTLLTGSSVWLNNEARLLLGWEACLLQCIPCPALPGAAHTSRKKLIAIAGDAFCGASYMQVLLGLMAHIPTDIDMDNRDEERDFVDNLIWEA